MDTVAPETTRGDDRGREPAKRIGPRPLAGRSALAAAEGESRHHYLILFRKIGKNFYDLNIYSNEKNKILNQNPIYHIILFYRTKYY